MSILKLPRTRFSKDIVAEYYEPVRPSNKVIIFCDGMPSMPHHQETVQFYGRLLSSWVFYPRYRGAWESGGKFLKNSPHKDILDIIDQLPKGFTNAKTNKKFKIKNPEFFLIGNSFGGPAVILASKDSRVKKVVTRAGVVDWLAQSETERLSWFEGYLKQAFGEAYRFDHKDWKKLMTGKFYNPANELKNIDGTKILMFHAKDDPVVGYKSVKKFANDTGSKLITLTTGGHLSNSLLKPRFVKMIVSHFK